MLLSGRIQERLWQRGFALSAGGKISPPIRIKCGHLTSLGNGVKLYTTVMYNDVA